MPYRFVEDVSIADVAFEASGKNMEEMFVSAAEALMNTQVRDLKTIKAEEEAEFELKSPNEEKLLHDFLQELIFFKDAKLLLVREYKLRVFRAEGGGFRLKAGLKGERIDQKKHELLVDVKAVSWHMFKVERTKDGWKAFVILDV
jgi:SHS2 domain-containing protein